MSHDTCMTADASEAAAGMLCRGCASDKTSVVADLGVIPASDWFPLIDDPAHDPRWPLRLYMCEVCLLVQLGPDVHPAPEPPRADRICDIASPCNAICD